MLSFTNFYSHSFTVTTDVLVVVWLSFFLKIRNTEARKCFKVNMKFKGRITELDKMDRKDTSLIACTTTQLHSVQTFIYIMVIVVGR